VRFRGEELFLPPANADRWFKPTQAEPGWGTR
jgi:hypothetical protein